MHRGKNITGNDRFYGFCVDILDRVAQEVGFEYIIDLVPDRKYGAQDPVTGEWNGMVAQLMKHVSSLEFFCFCISRICFDFISYSLSIEQVDLCVETRN